MPARKKRKRASLRSELEVVSSILAAQIKRIGDLEALRQKYHLRFSALVSKEEFDREVRNGNLLNSNQSKLNLHFNELQSTVNNASYQANSLRQRIDECERALGQRLSLAEARLSELCPGSLNASCSAKSRDGDVVHAFLATVTGAVFCERCGLTIGKETHDPVQGRDRVDSNGRSGAEAERAAGA